MAKKTIFSKSAEFFQRGLGAFSKDRKAISTTRVGEGNGRFNHGIMTLSDGSLVLPKKGLSKTGVTFDQLRQVARHDAITRICINTIKKEVSQAEWAIVPKKRATSVNKEGIIRMTDLFERVNSQGENIRMLLDMVLEDLLSMDAGPIEKVYNYKGELTELNSIDGATIRPRFDQFGRFDPNRAYVQVIENHVVAEFKANEIIYMMQNPQNDVKLFGYGMSPIESVLLQVQASLEADLYNARSFSENNIPPGMLDLGDMTEEEAMKFKAVWDATVIDNTHKLKFIWGNDNAKKYIPFQKNNKDMQFVEYIDWLSRIKLAVYGLSSQDANILQDVNRSTAQVQERISNARGVNTIKNLVAEYWTREIIRPAGYEDLEFKFETAVSLEEKKKQAEIDEIYINMGVYRPVDVANREGFKVSEQPEEEDYDVKDPLEEDEETISENMEEEEGSKDDDVEVNNTQKKKTHFRTLY